MKRFIFNIGIYALRILYGLTILTTVIGGIGSKASNESWWPTIFTAIFVMIFAHFLLLKPSRALVKLRDGEASGNQKQPAVLRLSYDAEVSRSSSSPRIEVRSHQQDYPSTYQSPSRPSGRQAKWYGRGESVTVQGYEIKDVMAYVGESLPSAGGYGNDASLINPKLKTAYAHPWDGGQDMGYWPEYAGISEKCRGAYIAWLASGRSEPRAYIGYVFLFFYGLERRLLIDGQKGIVSAEERNGIVSEIQRLLKIYGENRSFHSYANALLAAEWILYRNDAPLPDYIDVTDKYRALPFKIVLARQVLSKRPVPADMALRWALLQEHFWPRTPARRCPKEFEALFALKYEEKFGEGLLVEPNKSKLKFEYRPASPSIRFEQDVKMKDLPNPFILSGHVRKLIEIAEECTDKLDAYSRYLGRKDNDPQSIAALALLPKELMGLTPRAGKVRERLEQLCASGFDLIPIKSLYDAMGTHVPTPFGKKDAEGLALLVEGMGFGVAPDVRFHNAKPAGNSHVCIFSRGHGPHFAPSKEFNTVGTILRLGAMVSQSDNDIAVVEDMMLKGLIQENRELSPIEKDSLLAFLHWSLRVPQGTDGLKQQLTNISATEKMAIGRILISIALADGRIDPREIKQLEKLYASLGLDKNQVTGDIHTLSGANQPVTVARRDASATFSIPKAPVQVKQGFSLNEELIRIRVEETRQVKGVLETIFADDSNEVEANVVNASNGSPANSLSALDEAHQKFFHRIMEQETWERSKLQELSKEMGLMVDGAMETLNEWAFNKANAPLIDDGDLIYVDTNLGREILNA